MQKKKKKPELEKKPQLEKLQIITVHAQKWKKPRSFADLFTGGFIDFKINTDVE